MEEREFRLFVELLQPIFASAKAEATGAKALDVVIDALRTNPQFANTPAELIQRTIATFERMRGDAAYATLSSDHPIQLIKNGQLGEFAQYLRVHPETMDDTDNGSLKMTLMHYAAVYNKDEIVEYLIQIGSRARTIRDVNGNLPIHNSMHPPRFTALDVFIRHDTDMNVSTHPTEGNIIRLALVWSKLYVDDVYWREIIQTLIVGGALYASTEIEPFLPTEEDILRIRHRIFFERSLLDQLLLVMV